MSYMGDKANEFGPWEGHISNYGHHATPLEICIECILSGRDKLNQGQIDAISKIYKALESGKITKYVPPSIQQLEQRALDQAIADWNKLDK